MTTLDPGQYLSALAADSEAIADLAGPVLNQPVAACPEWTVTTLVGHLGGVYDLAVSAVEAAGDKPARPRLSAPDDPAELLGWFRQRRHAVLEALSDHPPEDPAWTFARFGQPTVGWWRRRQVLETAVHLFDVQMAAGHPGTTSPELAADGVDEVLREVLPGYLARHPEHRPSGTLHVHATDTPGEWSLDFAADDLAVTAEHTKADAAARGPAAGLMLWLWGRSTPDEAGLELFGDGATADALAGMHF